MKTRHLGLVAAAVTLLMIGTRRATPQTATMDASKVEPTDRPEASQCKRDEACSGRPHKAKMFDFERFKATYLKRYESTVEEMVRLKVFLAHAYEVFVSAVAYLHRLKSYYLKINARSDWLPQELETNRNRFVSARGQAGIEHEKEANEHVHPVELVEPDELEAELRKIREQAGDPRYAPLARELAKMEATERGGRRKRGLPVSPVVTRGAYEQLPRIRPNFDVSKAFAGPDATETFNTKRRRSSQSTLKSNNPHWHQPEVFTMGRRDYQTEPGYRKLLEKAVVKGVNRTYDHLPVKGNYKTTGVFNWAHNRFLDYKASLFSAWFANAPAAGRQSSDAGTPAAEESRDDQFGGDVIWVDHRDSGCLNPVQDQGRCNSCYAFSSLAFIEWAHCRATGELAKFSEQYVLDCGPMTDEWLLSCRGGDLIGAAHFHANFGLELAKHYPYTARDDACPYRPEAERESMGFLRVNNLSNVLHVGLEHAEQYLKRAPMIITMYAGGKFSNYGGGVYDGRDCPPNEADHLVLVVGHGREDGEEYWLIRNSYGLSWGEAGHMKLNKNSHCIHPRLGRLFRAALPDVLSVALTENASRDTGNNRGK